MNRLEVARDAIVQAIAPVLSGRVYPYPPSPQQAQMAPAVWIGQADGQPTIIGERTEVTQAIFPIHVVYDGADRAQVAGLDDIISGLVDAVAAVPGAHIRGWRTEPPDFNGTSRRASTVEVEYIITATTLCLPDVGGDVIHRDTDVVEGSQDVVWHATILADPPPDTPAHRPRPVTSNYPTSSPHPNPWRNSHGRPHRRPDH